jgi:hypothetical protein
MWVFSLNVKIEPTPKVEDTSNVPYIALAILLQMLKPKPCPFRFISKLSGLVVLKNG